MTVQYAVVGATGHTGALVAERLLAAGKSVRVISRDAQKLKSLEQRGAVPIVGSASDEAAIVRAFQGVDIAYTMIPPVRDAKKFGDVLVRAVAQAGVSYVVNLSGAGAHRDEGILADYFYIEQEFRKISALNVLQLRVGFFMENLYRMIDGIKTNGKMTDLLRGDVAMPLIASKDIGEFAADAMLNPTFTGRSTRELLGQRDVTMADTAKIIGKAINQPDLSYEYMSPDRAEIWLANAGYSSNEIKRRIETYNGFNSGHISPLEPRSPRNTTPTSIETFVSQDFVRQYHAS